MEETWVRGLLGGLLIGTAAAAHLLLNGRVAGTSGMLGATLARLTGGPADETARLSMAFLAGAFGAALAVSALWFRPALTVTTSVPTLVLSGLLVGAGVAFANGCTSGHGVCGLSRLSVRSMAATATFMAATAAVVFLTRHVAGGAP
jgi:uncharacterized membrane protein YedE/YeeE